VAVAPKSAHRANSLPDSRQRRAPALAICLLGLLLLPLASPADERGPWRASERNTRGWQLMTPEERVEHQARIRSFRTDLECRDYQTRHHQLMKERARQLGAELPPAGRDFCRHLQATGNDQGVAE